MASDRVRESIIVAADIGEVYDTVTRYESYPDWMDEFKQVEVLSRGADGHATAVRFALSAMGIAATMTLAYTYSDRRIEWVLVEGDMVTANDGAYDLTDNADGTTLLTYELAVETAVPLPGLVRRRFAKRTVTDSLRAIKQRAES